MKSIKLILKVMSKATLLWVALILLTLVISEVFLEKQSSKDVVGFVVTSFAYLLVMSMLVWFPVLTYLSNTFSNKYVPYYFLITGILLNIPFFIFAVLMIGKAFQVSEAILFCGVFMVLGAFFGSTYGNQMKKKKEN